MVQFAAVCRVIAIVAHHEDMIFGNGDFGEVVQILILVVDDEIGCAIGQGFAHHGYAANRFAIGVGRAEVVETEAVAARVGIERQGDGGFDLLFDRGAVEDDLAVAYRDPVTRECNDALDVILIALRVHGNDDVAIFRGRAEQAPLATRGKVKADRRPVPAVGIFAHHQPVSDQQVRHHRFRRDIEWLRDEAVKRENSQQHQRQTADFRDPVDLVVSFLFLLAGVVHCRCAGGHLGRASMMT